MPTADRLRAVDLITGHDDGCEAARAWDAPCYCHLAERRQAARDIDARAEALAGMLGRVQEAIDENWLDWPDARRLIKRDIDALLAEAPRG